MITVQQFLNNFENMLKCKTLYIMGGFGCALTDKRKARILGDSGYAYNKNDARKKKILAASADTFGFDCAGSVKGNLWGFVGNPSKVYGGATYKSNGVPDTDALGFLKRCTDVSTDFSKIVPGAFLYMNNHCGVYKGNGEVYEASPAYKDGFQVTKLSQRKWLKWGLLTKDVIYEQPTPTPKPVNVPVLAKHTLRQGSKGMQVEYLQKDLNYLGEKLDTDGIFGPKTKAAVIRFQKSCAIAQDGIYGPISENNMRKKLCK